MQGSSAGAGSSAVVRFRAPDAARHVGLSPATLAKLRCRGDGPAFIKLGRAVVYDRQDLDDWCESKRKVTSTSADLITRLEAAVGRRRA